MVGKAFLKVPSFSKCVQIAFLRLVLLRLRIKATGIGQAILDWRVCCLAPLICFIRRDLRDHGPRWRRPRLPAACCTCACGASVRTRGGSKNRCHAGSGGGGGGASASAARSKVAAADQCPLSGVKRTCHFALQMSAYDPKRTSGSQSASL